MSASVVTPLAIPGADALAAGYVERATSLAAVETWPVETATPLAAVGIGDPFRAAFLLGLPCLGTFPTLFVYGTALGSISAGRRRSMHRVLGAAFLLLGYLPLSHGLMLLGIHLPHPTVPIYQPLG